MTRAQAIHPAAISRNTCGGGKSPKQGSAEPIAALNRVRILEYGRSWEQREPLVDVRIACPEVVWHERICPFLRAAVATMVNNAQSDLPPGYRLKAGTALRTLTMQKRGWDGYFERMRDEHPKWPLSALRRATNKYFAPYDQKAPPGHCTGGAIDVAVLGPDGEALDMTSPTEGWDGASTWSDKLSDGARTNRMMMVRSMLGAGFSNCRDEFWHYSWGDSAWAVRVGRMDCEYGWSYPPIEFSADYDGGRAEELEAETFREEGGKPVRGITRCQVIDASPENGDAPFSAGIYWARDVPVTVHIDGFAGARLFTGDGENEWTPIDDLFRTNGNMTATVTPQWDRTYIVSAPPPPKPETP